MLPTELTEHIEGFEWDDGNLWKSRRKHGVSPAESEQVFFNRPLVLLDDPRHSCDEARFYALGKTDEVRRLFVSFTVRGRLIRVISARPMSRRERWHYEEHAQETGSDFQERG